MPLFLPSATDRLASVGHIGSCRFPCREGGTFLLHFPVRQACTFFLLRYNGGIRKPQGDGRRPPPSAGRRAAPAGFGCAETACGRRLRFSGGCRGRAEGCGGGWEGKVTGARRRSRARPQAGPRARSARPPRVRGAAAPYFAGCRGRRGRQKGRPGRGAPIAACGFSGFSAGHGSRPAAFPHWKARAVRRELPPRRAFPAWHGRYLPP